MPLPKWKVANRNLQPGDVCLLAFQASYGPGRYKLCRVLQVFLDRRGLVRDVEILLRPTRSNEDPRVYKPTKMTKMVVAIQRLVLIVRNEDVMETTDPVLDPSSERPGSKLDCFHLAQVVQVLREVGNTVLHGFDVLLQALLARVRGDL